MQTIFNFDAFTGEFISSGYADESPLETGVYLMPANSTTAAPPATARGKIAIWRNGGWHVIDDRRGETYWLDGAQFVITEAGVAPPENSTPTSPVPSAAAVKQEKIDAVNAELSRRKYGGVKVKVGTSNKWFDNADSERVRLLLAASLGANLPAGTQWKTLDGGIVLMTPQILSNIILAIVASDQAIFAAAESHLTAIAASSAPQAYDFSTGWPPQYTP